MTETEVMMRRLALLYEDLMPLRGALDATEKEIIKNIEVSKDKVLVFCGCKASMWNTYPLAYLLNHHIVSPTVLTENDIYRSVQSMRVNDKYTKKPQELIGNAVVIYYQGSQSSLNINEHLNLFLSMCRASARCEVVILILNIPKKDRKLFNKLTIKSIKSSFIDSKTQEAVEIETTPLDIIYENIIDFSPTSKSTTKKSSSESSSQGNKSSNNLSLDNYDF